MTKINGGIKTILGAVLVILGVGLAGVIGFGVTKADRAEDGLATHEAVLWHAGSGERFKAIEADVAGIRSVQKEQTVILREIHAATVKE